MPMVKKVCIYWENDSTPHTMSRDEFMTMIKDICLRSMHWELPSKIIKEMFESD